ncbi:restriction endonuclease subunit S [Natrinema gelatinilyticum]|uniref:restriction endonuclease subunit S n=1 Tax=Natrinema gelatinilyticum TaxID=2961571 RepID=UPI0020C1F4F2|nr:restriction endonuclease subunit S [Natrinema gelatinilyticum]
MSEQDASLDDFVEEQEETQPSLQEHDWDTKELAQVADITMGTSPKSEYYNEDGNGLPFFQSNDEFGFRSPTHDRWCSNPRKIAQPGDLLMTIRGTYVGQTNIADRESCIGRGLAGITPGGPVNGEFLFQYLNYIEPYVKSIAIGSTFDSVSSAEIDSLEIDVPPIQEQRKIASVLYNVDQAINTASKISEQVERVERGLQQALFSGKHLDSDLKEISTLGEIPEHWGVRPMGEICEITMGSSPKSEHYNESGDGLPFFQANNEFGLRSPKHDRWCSNPVKTADENDSLMTLRGTYVGQMNTADRECCIGRGLAGISAGGPLLEEYLYQHLRRRERYVKSIAIGSTFDSVSSDDLERLQLAFPPEEEQKQIGDILKHVQERLIFTESYTDQLQRFKQGLKQDLLSGTVRTIDTNIEVLPEVEQYG